MTNDPNSTWFVGFDPSLALSKSSEDIWCNLSGVGLSKLGAARLGGKDAEEAVGPHRGLAGNR